MHIKGVFVADYNAFMAWSKVIRSTIWAGTGYQAPAALDRSGPSSRLAWEIFHTGCDHSQAICESSIDSHELFEVIFIIGKKF